MSNYTDVVGNQNSQYGRRTVQKWNEEDKEESFIIELVDIKRNF